MNDRFTGDWLVTEYVHNANGSFVGIIQQRRKLQPLGDGRTRVIQQCAPGTELNGHPMAGFAGEWVFELTREGRARRYHGPDVVGMGLAWGENCITGRGVWPRFGHNFTSFGVLVTPERQITGGKFCNAGEMIANIVGVAVPETRDAPDAFPVLAGAFWPGEISTNWHGKRWLYDGDGSLAAIAKVEVEYQGDGWRENAVTSGTHVVSTTRLEALKGRIRVQSETDLGTVLTGIGQCSGWLLDTELHSSEEHGKGSLIMDSAGGWVVSIDEGWSENVHYGGLGLLVMTPTV